MANVKDERRPHRARLLCQQEALELLAFCDRKITVARPGWCKVFHRVRTLVPTAHSTIGEHVHKKRKQLRLHQWELANMLGVWGSTLGSWEANRYQPEGRVRDRVIVWLGFDRHGKNDEPNI